MEEVRLHEGAGGLDRGVVVDQGSVFLGRCGVLVAAATSLVHEEIGDILRSFDAVIRVVDGLLRHASSGLSPPTPAPSLAHRVVSFSGSSTKNHNH